MRKQYRLWQLVLLVCWCLATNLQAQDEVVLTPVTKTYAITNVNINQAPGKKIEMGTILIKDGVIKAVGKNITIPADAWVIKADSMQAYAGFIDGFSRTGVTKPKEEGRERLKDPGNPPPDKAGITPQSDVRTFINPADKAIDEWRNAGFTLAHVAPYGGMLPGQTALILLGGTGTDNMVLQNNAALYSELTPAERMYPNTIIGVMAKFRELYQQASLTKSYEAVYASNRNGLERPQPDRVLQAFYPVIDKKQAVAFKAEKVLDVQRVINLQKDLGFNLTLVDVKEGWDVINKIKNANAKVFLSLDLPEKKKEDKKEEKKEDKKDEKKENKPDKPKTATELEKEALDKRKEEFTNKYFGQASAFQKAGVAFAFSTNNAKAKDLPATLRNIIAAGLTEDQALAALTTTPAQLLGIGDRVGTLEVGKMANIVISDKSYFNEKAKVRYVFVDGVLYKQEVKESKEEKKTEGSGKKADASGRWSYTADTPQGANTGIISIKNDGGKMTGTLTSSMANRDYELQDISIDGNKLSFYYNADFGGNALKVEFNVALDATIFEGTMTAGRFGSFPVKGNKEP